MARRAGSTAQAAARGYLERVLERLDERAEHHRVCGRRSPHAGLADRLRRGRAVTVWAWQVPVHPSLRGWHGRVVVGADGTVRPE